MTNINVITGRAKEGFKSETLTLADFQTQLKTAQDFDDIGFISVVGNELFLSEDEADSEGVLLSNLPEEDKNYLLKLLEKDEYLVVRAAYIGWVTCDKNGMLYCFYEGDNGEEVAMAQTEECIKDEDGETIPNDNYNRFEEDTMQVIQWLPYADGEVEPYDESGYHVLFEGTTTIYLFSGSGKYVSAPQSLLDIYLKRIKVVRG